MDAETRKGRELDALEIIAEQLEKLRMLKEYELGARVKDDGGTLNVIEGVTDR
jgi:hypothetical protein